MIYDKMSKRRKDGKDRLLLSVIMNEITTDGKPMNDKDAVKKLSQMKKQSTATLKLYKKAKKEKQALEEQKYIDLIDIYLPKGTTEDDIIKTIDNLNISKNIKNMGILMKELKKSFEVVDGNKVRNILLEEG